MSNHDDAAGDDALAAIDLHAWSVPPPAAVDGPALVLSALSPAAAPPKRPRAGWLFAAIVLINAVIAALLMIFLARPPASPTTVTVAPAGDGVVDARVRIVLERLDREEHELQAKLAEIQELRALVLELSDKVHKLEDDAARRDHTVLKPPAHPAPERVDPPVAPVDQPVAPVDQPVAPADSQCDEVSCVLTGVPVACCAKYRKSSPPAAKTGPPDSLDRAAISNGVASVKASVAACAGRSSAKGIVKLHVRVAATGLVTNVTVAATPDAALGACVSAAVQRAVFPRTQNGGSFSYPFVF